jgi:plastocyanin
MTSFRSRLTGELATSLAIAGLTLSCSGNQQRPNAPSAIAANDRITFAAPFGVLTPDLASCLRAPSPSCFSGSAVHRATAATGGVLAAPIDLSSSVVGTSVTLRWTAPPGTATGYVIEAGSATGLADLAIVSTGTTATTFSAAGVPAGMYYVRVRALDATQTTGLASNEAVVVVATPLPCSLPAVPTGLSVTSNGGGTVALQWNPATGATSYVLEAGTSSGLANLANADVGATTTFTASGVDAGTYFVRVRGKNNCGTTGASNEVTLVVTTSSPPPPPPPSPGATVTIVAGAAMLTITAFNPNPIDISRGTTVMWVNHDTITHTSTSDVGIWNSDNIPPGGSFAATFQSAGTFAYHCAIHPNMMGSVTVH